MGKTTIKIVSKLGSVLFEHEAENNSLKNTLEEAIAIGADLSGADLSGADLRGANLSGANLSGADLSGADLRGADLRGANLRGANLSGANLSGANLSDADLSGAAIDYNDDNDYPNSLATKKCYALRNSSQLASIMYHVAHNARNCRCYYSCMWKNVLKIKSWTLKTDTKPQSAHDNENIKTAEEIGKKIADSIKRKYCVEVTMNGVEYDELGHIVDYVQKHASDGYKITYSTGVENGRN